MKTERCSTPGCWASLCKLLKDNSSHPRLEDGGSAGQTCWASGADRDGSAGLAVEMHENWIEAVRYWNMEYVKEHKKRDLRKFQAA